MSYDFISQLSESAMIRNKKALKQFNARDIADLIFLYFLALQILRNDFEEKPEAVKYAEKTIAWGNINYFRNSATDLYILMYTLFGSNNDSELNLLDNQEANKLLLQNMQFDYTQVKKWLSNLAGGNEETDKDNQFLRKLEAMLLIKNGDYKSVRRLASEWNNIDLSAKQLATTRLLMAFRAKAKKSELLSHLEKFAKNNKLEIKGVKNPEVDAPKAKNWKGAAIGAAIGGAIVANAVRKFVQDAGKAKSFK